MQPNQVAISTLLWVPVKTVAYRTMTHYLCNMRLVLTGEGLLVDAETFASLCEGPSHQTIKPLLVAGNSGIS
jgi:hypothetical protein